MDTKPKRGPGRPRGSKKLGLTEKQELATAAAVEYYYRRSGDGPLRGTSKSLKPHRHRTIGAYLKVSSNYFAGTLSAAAIKKIYDRLKTSVRDMETSALLELIPSIGGFSISNDDQQRLDERWYRRWGIDPSTAPPEEAFPTFRKR